MRPNVTKHPTCFTTADRVHTGYISRVWVRDDRADGVVAAALRGTHAEYRPSADEGHHYASSHHNRSTPLDHDNQTIRADVASPDIAAGRRLPIGARDDRGTPGGECAGAL
ncbi:hypothetical protein GCM10022140_47450 [Rhodococcus aetherivorans]